MLCTAAACLPGSLLHCPTLPSTAQLSRSATHVRQFASMNLQVLRSFGAGVILATGFVHMFPDASEALGSECLGWPASFPWAAFIALMTSLAVLVSHARWAC